MEGLKYLGGVKMADTERINVHIPTYLKEWLRDYADRRNMSMGGVVKQVLFEEMESDKVFLKMDKKRQILDGVDGFVEYMVENDIPVKNEDQLMSELKKYKKSKK